MRFIWFNAILYKLNSKALEVLICQEYAAYAEKVNSVAISLVTVTAKHHALTVLTFRRSKSLKTALYPKNTYAPVA